MNDVPGDALEDIAYLSRSENRVAVLGALAEQAYPRRELEEVTGTSKTTLSRILNQFEEREWARRNTDGEYEITPRGEHMAAEFGHLTTSVETLRDIGDTVAVLPIEELSIGLHNFGDATVRRPEPNEPNPTDYLADRVRDSSTFYSLSWVAPTEPLGRVLQEEVLAGELTLRGVHAGGLDDYIRSNLKGPPRWQELLESGAEFYRYEGHIPCNMAIVDAAVFIENSNVDGLRPGTWIESGDETVRRWALDLFERYREDAEEVETFAQS